MKVSLCTRNGEFVTYLTIPQDHLPEVIVLGDSDPRGSIFINDPKNSLSFRPASICVIKPNVDVAVNT